MATKNTRTNAAARQAKPIRGQRQAKAPAKQARQVKAPVRQARAVKPERQLKQRPTRQAAVERQARQPRHSKVEKSTPRKTAAVSNVVSLGLSIVTSVTGDIQAKVTHYLVNGIVIPKTLVVAIAGRTVYYRATVNLGELADVVDVKGTICYVNTAGDKIVVQDTSALSLTSGAASGAKASPAKTPSAQDAQDFADTDVDLDEDDEDDEPVVKKSKSKKPVVEDDEDDEFDLGEDEDDEEDDESSDDEDDEEDDESSDDEDDEEDDESSDDEDDEFGDFN